METIAEPIHYQALIIFALLSQAKMLMLFINKEDLLRHFTDATEKPERFVVWVLLIGSIYRFTLHEEMSHSVTNQISCVFLAIPLSIVAFKMQFRIMSVAAFILLLVAIFFVSRQQSNQQNTEHPTEVISQQAFPTVHPRSLPLCFPLSTPGFLHIVSCKKNSLPHVRRVVRNSL